MKWVKVLSVWFFAAIMLVAVNSCGVPDPIEPTATAVPADGSTINNSDSIVITFSASMTSGSLTLSGNMATESDSGVWSNTSQTNDTLTINPGVASGGVWTAGSHTLIVDVVATNSGVPLSTLTLNYTVDAVVPTAVVVPANAATIIGSDLIVILFSVAMEPSTLILTGDMAAESNGGTWSTTSNTNDTLAIRPLTAWPETVTTLVIDVDSVADVSLPTFTLNYTVDASVPIAIASPADSAAINETKPVVITFTASMEPVTLVLAGTLASESDGGVWSSLGNTDNTLTISPNSTWTSGPHTLVVDVDGFNTVPLPTLSLDYTVDAVLPTASVTPANNSLITGGRIIVIDFSKAMEATSLMLTGSILSAGYGTTWSTEVEVDDRLTIFPTSAWAAGTAGFILDAVDLAGNPLVPLDLTYTVDVITPTVDTVTPADSSILYSADNIVIVFSESMDPGTPVFTGSLSPEVGTSSWSNGANDNDTLTISPSILWTTGAQTLDVPAGDVAGNPMVPLNLIYTVALDMCSDGIKNDEETDIDCGGSICLACSDGDACSANTDCNSNICDTGVTDTCLTDFDSDGWADGVDNCPAVSNPAQLDTDGDDVGDLCDVIAPVITVTAGTDTVEQGGIWIDAGATASDNNQDDISADIVTDASAVNVTVVGSYTVTYNVSDEVGNPAVEATRIVTVTADATPPVITVTAGTDTVEQGGTWIDAGATALDNTDGVITGSIVTVNPVDVNTVGTYTVTYDVDDAAGNSAVQVTRTVNVTADVTIPVIALVGSDPVNIELGSAYVDAGATAEDNTDGDITGSIVTVNLVDVDTVGTYTVTYDVDDAAGNSAVQVTRTVNVTADVTIPVIALVGSDPVNIERGTPYVDAGATALDNIDGVITGSIVTVNPVDVNTVGTYTVTYDVDDVAGNPAAQVTRTVNVTADATVPVITLVGSDPVNIVQGASYVDAGATALDNIDGVITGSIVTVNPVDVNTVGTYTVTYDVDDAAGNLAVQVTRTVNVTI